MPLPPPHPLLIATVDGDFNGDGQRDQAGLAADHTIWLGITGQPWRQLPGWLATLVVGDFNGDGHDDLAGLDGTHRIFVMTDTVNWRPLPGWLMSLVVGDFNGDGRDDLAGLDGTHRIFLMTDLTNWHDLPGVLDVMVAGDFSGSGHAELVGITIGDARIWWMHDMINWEPPLPGLLISIRQEPGAPGQPDVLVGQSPDGRWFRAERLGAGREIPAPAGQVAQVAP